MSERLRHLTMITPSASTTNKVVPPYRAGFGLPQGATTLLS